MKLYQSPDGTWTGTQADAKAHARDNATTWKEVEVPVDKAGLMAFLNRHKVGGSVAAPVVFPAFSPPAAAPVAAPVYGDRSIAIDDAWDGLPLSRQLHFAALAMEEARSKIN